MCHRRVTIVGLLSRDTLLAGLDNGNDNGNRSRAGFQFEGRTKIGWAFGLRRSVSLYIEYETNMKRPSM
jgi:hypothetical protein